VGPHQVFVSCRLRRSQLVIKLTQITSGALFNNEEQLEDDDQVIESEETAKKAKTSRTRAGNKKEGKAREKKADKPAGKSSKQAAVEEKPVEKASEKVAEKLLEQPLDTAESRREQSPAAHDKINAENLQSSDVRIMFPSFHLS